MLQGKPFTSIEPGVKLNDLCAIPNTGMLFIANEAPKIQTFYIPVSTRGVLLILSLLVHGDLCADSDASHLDQCQCFVLIGFRASSQMVRVP